MCGQTEELEQRSLITGNKGLVTYVITTPNPFYRPNYIIMVLKHSFEETVVRELRKIKLCQQQNMAVFDSPSKNAFIFDQFIELQAQEKQEETDKDAPPP